MEAVDIAIKTLLTDEFITSVVDLVPDSWLVADSPFATPVEHRAAYVKYLTTRLAHSDTFVKQAQYARENPV
jgi:hypothetical protein